MLRSLHRTITLLLFIFSFLSSPLQPSLLAQVQYTSKLIGTVYDETKQPLPAVTIRIKGTQQGTTTDSNGMFCLYNVPVNAKLVFSFIGKKSKTITYKGEKEIVITLSEDEQMLSEVTVQAKANINEIDIRAKAGVVQTVDMKRVEQKPMINLGLALQGALPGLVVANMGELGTPPVIRIRGNSSLRRGNSTNAPLYVLDGQIITPEAFYNLNPTDIKDIKVLKNAAATALYGVRAANGVLEITSQRGVTGSPSVTYSMNFGVTTRGRRGIAMMQTNEKLELERLLRNEAAPGYRYSADYYKKYFPTSPDLEQLIAEGATKLDSLRNINTDWFKELLHTNLYQQYNLSVRGGNENTSYYLSTNYTKQGGRIPGNEEYRMGVRLNLDQKLAQWGYLLLSINSGLSHTNTPVGTSFDPTSLIYDLNPYETRKGKLYSYPGQTFNDLLHQFSADGQNKDLNLSSSVNLTPIEGLDLSASAGLSLLLAEQTQFTPATAYSETHSGIPQTERGIYSKGKNVVTNLTTNIRATYHKVFNNNHDVTFGANTDWYYYNLDGVLMRGYGVGILNSASAINQAIQGNRHPYVFSPRDRNAQIGIGVVTGYTYNETYDLYATCKWDASSVLPREKRWNMAWAVGGGWTPTQYAILKENKILTRLNLKASYGYTANLNGISPSATLATFAFGSTGYEGIRPIELQSLYNLDLKPEQTKSIDVGASIGFFKRVSLDCGWYMRTTEQALLEVPIPASTGFTSLTRNIGVLQNSGIEVAVNIQAIETPDWLLSIGSHFAYNRNKVVDLYNTDRIYTSDDALMPDYQVGYPYDMLYGSHAIGINPLTGYYTFLLPNGEEKQATEVVKREDVVALGHLTPPCNGSVSLSLSYKALEIAADFYYTIGGIHPFSYRYVRNKDNANKNAVAHQTEKMWFNVGDEGKVYPTPYYTSSTAEDNLSRFANSLTIGKSDYLKLSMLSVRYRLSPSWLSKHIPYVQYANLALQASNLFTWTSYKESDPESGTLAGTMQPVISFSINLTF